jgi:hypothetical protein
MIPRIGPRNITGREFPVWVDLSAPQSDLPASPLLTRVKRLLAELIASPRVPARRPNGSAGIFAARVDAT